MKEWYCNIENQEDNPDNLREVSSLIYLKEPQGGSKDEVLKISSDTHEEKQS